MSKEMANGLPIWFAHITPINNDYLVHEVPESNSSLAINVHVLLETAPSPTLILIIEGFGSPSLIMYNLTCNFL